VLLIDDEIAVRTAMRRFFERRGWQVTEVGDGGCARDLFAPNDAPAFDLVICDLRMPRFSGCELYRWLAATRPDVVDTLVFSTGDVHSADMAEFLAQARRPVLSKPFELGDLARVAKEVAHAA
jgi:CheY-like chemotaxis protein